MADPFALLYSRVHSIQRTVENLPSSMVLLEDARKVSRLTRRVEVLIMDLQPYVQPHPGAQPAPQFQTVLMDIDTQLAVMHDTINAMAVKGPLASLMQGDRLLSIIQTAAQKLATALDSIKGRLPEETEEELVSVKGLLQRSRFEPSPDHLATMIQFRAGVEAMTAAHKQIMGACSGILASMTGGFAQMSKETFEMSLAELIAEHSLVMSQGDPFGDSKNLRVMMDVLRMQQRNGEAPLPFICPLTHNVMRDPVVLKETGHSYERVAIEQWYNRGQRICPRTGAPLSIFKLNLVPNGNLKEAIEDWRLFGSLSVSWKEDDQAPGPLPRQTASATGASNGQPPALHATSSVPVPAAPNAIKQEATSLPMPASTSPPAALSAAAPSPTAAPAAASAPFAGPGTPVAPTPVPHTAAPVPSPTPAATHAAPAAVPSFPTPPAPLAAPPMYHPQPPAATTVPLPVQPPTASTQSPYQSPTISPAKAQVLQPDWNSLSTAAAAAAAPEADWDQLSGRPSSGGNGPLLAGSPAAQTSEAGGALQNRPSGRISQGSEYHLAGTNGQSYEDSD